MEFTMNTIHVYYDILLSVHKKLLKISGKATGTKLTGRLWSQIMYEALAEATSSEAAERGGGRRAAVWLIFHFVAI